VEVNDKKKLAVANNEAEREADESGQQSRTVERARSYGDLETTNRPNTGSKQTNKAMSVSQVSHAEHTEKAFFFQFVISHFC
jgi:hypothetical protein